MLNYATLKPGELINFKEGEGSTYDLLKKEIQGTLALTSIEELDVWYDDGFLLKEKPSMPSLIIKNTPNPSITDWDVVICGNIMFASSNEDGDTISLTEEATKILSKFKLALLGTNPVWVYHNYEVKQS
ncbi:hypothetical protein ACFWGV_20115 [Bacillus subtilis]|uniref:DUF3846 domain-containing protein n=1 Tax=Bacillus subtilis TaxID=1423 RepID=UPI000BA5B7D0|nr:hypothetical protein [Bacillus subtilis]MCM3386059.1 DUF3846 domain-containing protein [Bacillus subtilis]MDK8210178.1 hypothetical protein [Bacillus subtilis]MEC2389694.1 hypothetical protein [Bacillus subtilis]MED4522474.1 hypothetical protein [Bacillus subtilis]MED4623648.1 hypothetical protein [Bacillus subtilis]